MNIILKNMPESKTSQVCLHTCTLIFTHLSTKYENKNKRWGGNSHKTPTSLPLSDNIDASYQHTTLSIYTQAQRLVSILREVTCGIFRSIHCNTRNCCITIIYHAIEYILTNTINAVHNGKAGDSKDLLYFDWLYFLRMV